MNEPSQTNEQTSDLGKKLALYYSMASPEYEKMLQMRAKELTHPFWREAQFLHLVQRAIAVALLGQIPDSDESEKLQANQNEFRKDFEHIKGLTSDMNFVRQNALDMRMNQIKLHTYACFYYAASSAAVWSDVSPEECVLFVSAASIYFDWASEHMLAEAKNQLN